MRILQCKEDFERKLEKLEKAIINKEKVLDTFYDLKWEYESFFEVAITELIEKEEK